MKNVKLISATTIAVLTMTVNTMAMPATSYGVSFVGRNCTGNTCKNFNNMTDNESLKDMINKCIENCQQKPSVIIPNCENHNNCLNNNGSNNNNSNNNGSNNNGSNNNGSNNNGSNNNGNTNTDISEYAQRVVALVNEARAKEGLAALKIDKKVTSAAQVRAKEIKTSFSHTRPDGRNCFTALDEVGALYNGAGENIALGQKTPERVVKDWLNSEGHRKNIMSSNFKYIGVGVDGDAWTQLFTY